MYNNNVNYVNHIPVHKVKSYVNYKLICIESKI